MVITKIIVFSIWVAEPSSLTTLTEKKPRKCNSTHTVVALVMHVAQFWTGIKRRALILLQNYGQLAGREKSVHWKWKSSPGGEVPPSLIGVIMDKTEAFRPFHF